MPLIQATAEKPGTFQSAGRQASAIVVHPKCQGRLAEEDQGGPQRARRTVNWGGGHGGGHVSRGGGRGGGVSRGGGSRGGGGRGGGRRSDIRLKQDLIPLVRLNNGLELYRFRYKGRDQTTYVGVMAQEVQKVEPSAVWRDHDGYLMVDYDRIGLKFMTWTEWLARSGASSSPSLP